MSKWIYLIFVLFFLLCQTESVMSQQAVVNGIVLDENEQPLPGATVRVKNTHTGVLTDVNGRFVLKNVIPENLLVISFVGKKTEEVYALSQLRIVLKSTTEELEEALVQVAYGTIRKNAITGAVSTTNSEQINRRPVTTVTAALEGSMPGVVVNNTYGQPGDAPSIRIRGFGSVNGENDPLYVLDGVPLEQYFYREQMLSDLNPADVESISVLKDASAAALYGSRAANGVVLITLKKSREKRLTMEASVRQGTYMRGMKDYERIGSDDFMEVMWKVSRNSYLSTKGVSLEEANKWANENLISSVLKYNIYNAPSNQLFDSEGRLLEGVEVRETIREDLDWYAPLERNGYRQEYNLSGGAVMEKGDYRFSLGYMNEEGYLKNAGFDRLTARLQLNVDPKPWIGGGLTLAGTHQNQNVTNGRRSTNSNVYLIARNMAPIYPIHLHDLETGEYVLDANGEKLYDDGVLLGREQFLKRNIVWENQLNSDEFRQNSFTGNAYVDITLPAGFTFTVKGNLYLADQEKKFHYDPRIGDGIGVGHVYNYHFKTKRHLFQQQLNWQRKFGKHTAEILLAHENYNYNYQTIILSKSNQTLPDNMALNNYSTMGTLEGYPLDYRTEGYLARGRYQYDGKYFAEFSFRRDGSSRFHRNHRWGNFGSAGVSWLLSEEQFLKQSLWLDRLKVRFSYGEVGNDASVGYYGWMSLYTIDGNGGKAALYKSQNVAEDIQWETTAASDVAVEATLFDRWNVTIEYFDKRSKDLLFDVSLPLSSGAPSFDASKLATVARNLGSVSNRGWEFATDVDVIRSASWRWNVGMNATVLKNKIMTLPAENRKAGIIVVGKNQKYMEGHSVYEWWLPLFVGVDQLTGNALYLPDLERYYTGEKEEGKTLLAEAERVTIGDQLYTTNPITARRDWCGSALPDFYGSFSTQVDWKGLSLSALFTYSVGGKIFDKSYHSLMSVTSKPKAFHKDILKSWSEAPAGMEENSADRIDADGIPIINSVFNYAESSRFLIDGSYFAVKNITASYSLPANIIQKLDLQAVNFSVSMENLSFLSKRRGMNPQQDFRGVSDNTLLAPRVVSFGLTVKL